MPSRETYTGWGSGPWSRNGWGTPQVLVSVDGVGATSELGSVTAVVGKAVSVTGVGATGGVGNSTFAITINQSVTGVGGTANLGSIELPLEVSGFSATGQIGTVLVWSLIDTEQDPNWTIIKEAA